MSLFLYVEIATKQNIIAKLSQAVPTYSRTGQANNYYLMTKQMLLFVRFLLFFNLTL